MTSKLRKILAACNPQRVIAGLVFIPLLAYSFPPFREMDLPFSQRLVFWIGVMMLAVAATWTSKTLVNGHFDQLGRSMPNVTFTLLILALFTPSLWLLAWMLYTFSGQDAPDLLSVGTYGILFSAGLVLVSSSDVADSTSQPEESIKPRLTNRLPSGFSGQIYRLTVRDHNVDVVTSDGTFTIRSRFTDAINEMEPVPGHCTHRSHWVTDASITGTERMDGKIFLRLQNGDLVPVSRKYKPKLVEDGLL